MSEIWKALLEVQKEAPALQRDGLNPHFKSKYVTLETVMATVLPILNKHGVVLVQNTEFIDGVDVLATRLIHAESGDSVNADMRLVMSKDDAQGYGSAMTYARRYAIMGMLGLVADADDDGNAASAPQSRSKGKPEAPPPPTGWKKLEAEIGLYGETAWADFAALGAVARDMMLPEAQGKELTQAQKADLLSAAEKAAKELTDKFDPEYLPSPTVEDMRAAWAKVLGGELR